LSAGLVSLDVNVLSIWMQENVIHRNVMFSSLRKELASK